MTPNQTLARRARVASAASALGALAVVGGTLFTVSTRPAPELFSSLGFDSLAHVSAWQFAVARGLAALPGVVGGAAFVVLARAFVRVGQGHVFEPAMAQQLARFAALLAVGTALSVAVPVGASLLLSVGAPPEGGRLSLQLGSPQLMGLVASLAVWTFARLMGEAARIHTENQEFV
ncbi:MAG: DUF2975 domain-containing protein [Sandaracinaceae bacterium]